MSIPAREILTVGQLRKALDGVDDKMPVFATVEREDGIDFFSLDFIDAQKGVPARSERDDRAQLRFDSDAPGAVTWLLISLGEA